MHPEHSTPERKGQTHSQSNNEYKIGQGSISALADAKLKRKYMSRIGIRYDMEPTRHDKITSHHQLRNMIYPQALRMPLHMDPAAHEL